MLYWMKRKPTDDLSANTHRLSPLHGRQNQAHPSKPLRPGYIRVETETTVENHAINSDVHDEVLALVTESDIERAEPCCMDMLTATTVAESLKTHPAGFQTEVRIHYAEYGLLRQLPIIEASSSPQPCDERAVEQFVEAFTTSTPGESIQNAELADMFNRWHQNLTGESITLTWIGRLLSTCNIEQDRNTIIDRTWAEGVSPE